MKPPVVRKLAVTCVSDSIYSAYCWFQVLIISKCKHGLSTSMLLLLHSAFMLRVVKMLLKEEVGGSALNSHVNYIADHGKSWKNHGIVFLNFCGNPDTVYNRVYIWFISGLTLSWQVYILFHHGKG